MKTLDLELLTVMAKDVAAAAGTFRENFGFDVIYEDSSRTTLAIGPAGIEFAPATGDEGGLHGVTLRVVSLVETEKALRARGLSPETTKSSGKPGLAIGPDGTHGVRLVFVEG